MSDPRPTQRRWTADEKKKLDDLLEAGNTVVEIAPVLQEPPSSLCTTRRRYRKRPKPSTRWPSAI
jgi:transposase-like protein